MKKVSNILALLMAVAMMLCIISSCTPKTPGNSSSIVSEIIDNGEDNTSLDSSDNVGTDEENKNQNGETDDMSSSGNTVTRPGKKPNSSETQSNNETSSTVPNNTSSKENTNTNTNTSSNSGGNSGGNSDITPAPKYNLIDTSGMTDLQKAVVITAESFYLRGARAQYDMSYIITTKPRNPERRLVGEKAPEDYTLQNVGYTDCSGYVYDIFYNALGLKLVSSIEQCSTNIFASSNTNLVMRRWPGVEKTDFDTEAERKAHKEEFLSKIKPGDVIVYRYEGDTAGHTMLYVGNGMMLHSSGSSYNYTDKAEKYENKGTYLYDSIEETLFNPESRLYLFNKHKYTILRPLNSFTGTIPTKTLSRMEKMRGIVAEKLASHTLTQTVNPGDEITFTFSITNYGRSDKTLSISDTVPAYTTYISGADKKSGDDLSWSVKVPAGKNVKVSYKVKVEGSAGRSISSNSTIEAVPVKCPAILIKNTLTKAQQQKIVAAAGSLKSSSKSGLELADAIYKEAIGKSSISGKTSTDVLNGVFDYVSTNFNSWPQTWKKLKTSGAFINMLVPNTYGGRCVTEASPRGDVANARIRMVTADKLIVGDIIVCNDAAGDGYTPETYLFVGDKLINLSDKSETKLSFLDKLMGYRHFAVIRPSIAM